MLISSPLKLAFFKMSLFTGKIQGLEWQNKEVCSYKPPCLLGVVYARPTGLAYTTPFSMIMHLVIWVHIFLIVSKNTLRSSPCCTSKALCVRIRFTHSSLRLESGIKKSKSCMRTLSSSFFDKYFRWRIWIFDLNSFQG